MNSLLLHVFGLLWILIPLCSSRPAKIEKVKSDARNLTRIIITRIQQHPNQFLLPLNLKVSGLEFIPAERPLESLGSMDETLEIFHWILSSLPVDDVTQILWDIENLRALLQTLATTMGCELHQTTELETLKDLAKEHSTSPYTTEKVALDRLQKCLLTMVKELEQIKDC
ncbi:leptin [Latimeria chalumnae]|uniref:Leptin n=1 Tax=Latimeria chalumnae TaxID=7897 RepID=H3AP27_LATCH|nr:PREDICTED: leptin [Latimeria chalumnae]|eukprot:XP_006007898.1 PREDICTED: leptin [Latimeria chalumnae]